jgi:hypothetical protein
MTEVCRRVNCHLQNRKSGSSWTFGCEGEGIHYEFLSRDSNSFQSWNVCGFQLLVLFSYSSSLAYLRAGYIPAAKANILPQLLIGGQQEQQQPEQPH